MGTDVQYKKHNEVVNYAVFGVLTTVVNLVAYWLCSNYFSISTFVDTAIAWVVACLFAYVTNRLWVFDSKVKGASGIALEALSSLVVVFLPLAWKKSS